MAKKKKVEPKDDDDFEDIEEEEFESAYPEIEKKTPEEQTNIKGPQPLPSEEDDEDEEFEYELEEEPEIPDYKHLNLILTSGLTENDYELKIEGQSHGFCNILVKHLLTIKGVNMAAYKYTRIEPAQIFIRLESGHKIKEIIHQGIESLREEVIEVQNIFKKLT